MLRRGLRWGIDQCHEPGVIQQMGECWKAVSDKKTGEAIGEYCARYYKGDQVTGGRSDPNSDRIDTLRLYRNVCGLMATASAAAAYQRRTEDGGMGEVVRWWRGSAAYLDDVAAAQDPALPEAWPASLADLNAVLLKEQWDLTATRYWTAWWLRKSSGAEGNTQAIGMAATYGPIDGLEGFVADLILEGVQGAGNRLIEHPEGALLPVSKIWLRVLKDAAGSYGRALCWWVSCPDPVPWERRAFFGDSHGGAAAWGFWHVGQGKIADDRVVTLAAVRPGPGWPDHPEALVLGEVGGMVAKVKAIAECRRTDGTPRFDTIVVAGRDNEKQANAALGNKSEIRVKNLDAEDVEAIA